MSHYLLQLLCYRHGSLRYLANHADYMGPPLLTHKS